MNKKKHKIYIEELFQRFLANACLPEEVKTLMDYTDTRNESQLRELIEQQFSTNTSNDINQDTKLMLQQVYKQIELRLASTLPIKKTIPLNKWIPYIAAMFVLALAFSLYFFETGSNINSVKEEERNSQMVGDAMPGSNKAVLTLADGRTINLSSDHDGIILVGDEITYSDGSLVNIQNRNQDQHVQIKTTYNTITTPRGGQYQIKLPDGTVVWLNAASTLKYPNHFTGDSREVMLEGEAYFDVVKVFVEDSRIKDSRIHSKPFTVKTSNQEITVLGTEFNVSAYIDEEESKTTLVEGKLRINIPQTQNTVNLISGVEAISNGKSIKVHKADIESAIGWKDGDFIFTDVDIQTVMRKIARWYDVEVKFDGDVPEEKFTGQISRDKKLSEVLAVLKLSGGGNYRIENKVLHVNWTKSHLLQ